MIRGLRGKEMSIYVVGGKGKGKKRSRQRRRKLRWRGEWRELGSIRVLGAISEGLRLRGVRRQ